MSLDLNCILNSAAPPRIWIKQKRKLANVFKLFIMFHTRWSQTIIYSIYQSSAQVGNTRVQAKERKNESSSTQSHWSAISRLSVPHMHARSGDYKSPSSFSMLLQGLQVADQSHAQREPLTERGSGNSEAGRWNGFRLYLREVKRRGEHKRAKRGMFVCVNQRSPPQSLTSPTCLDEEHFRLILKTRAIRIVKKTENFLQLEKEQEEKVTECFKRKLLNWFLSFYIFYFIIYYFTV